MQCPKANRANNVTNHDLFRWTTPEQMILEPFCLELSNALLLVKSKVCYCTTLSQRPRYTVAETSKYCVHFKVWIVCALDASSHYLLTCYPPQVPPPRAFAGIVDKIGNFTIIVKYFSSPQNARSTISFGYD